jgi:hypothetical protein
VTSSSKRPPDAHNDLSDRMTRDKVKARQKISLPAHVAKLFLHSLDERRLVTGRRVQPEAFAILANAAVARHDREGVLGDQEQVFSGADEPNASARSPGVGLAIAAEAWIARVAANCVANGLACGQGVEDGAVLGDLHLRVDELRRVAGAVGLVEEETREVELLGVKQTGSRLQMREGRATLARCVSNIGRSQSRLKSGTWTRSRYAAPRSARQAGEPLAHAEAICPRGRLGPSESGLTCRQRASGAGLGTSWAEAPAASVSTLKARIG